MSGSSFVWLGGIVAGALILQPAFGQKGAAPPASGNPGGGATAPAAPGTRPTTVPTQPNNTNSPGILAPIFVTGRVLLEDGTPPSSPVVIERVCHAQSHAEGYTDTKGYFSIQLFRPNNGVIQDASEDTMGPRLGGMSTGGMSPIGNGAPLSASPGGALGQDRVLTDCELRAMAPGYRSQSVMLAGRRPLDPPDVGVILLHRNSGSDEGSTVSVVSLAAPKDARKAYERGEAALAKRKTDDARKDFEKAVAAYPDYAAAWSELGKLQLAAGDAEGARRSFDAAVKADPKFVTPYVEISTIEFRAQHWQALADVTDKALRLDAFDYPQAFYYNAVANYYLKRLEQAERSAREAERLDTRHQNVSEWHLLGAILAQRQDYAGAAQQLRNYLKLAPDASDAETVRAQLAEVEKAGGLAQGKEK
jgi:tetratricopeptide (TPR) repeat protein